ELGITTSVSADIQTPGNVVLSAKLFGDIVRRLPDDTVSISVDEKLVTNIVSGVAKFSIVGIPAEEYTDLPTVSGAENVLISSPVLKSMIRQTLFAVSDNDAKPIHTGTLFEIAGGFIRLVSVDGYRLAMRTEPLNLNNQPTDEIH